MCSEFLSSIDKEDACIVHVLSNHTVMSNITLIHLGICLIICKTNKGCIIGFIHLRYARVWILQLQMLEGVTLFILWEIRFVGLLGGGPDIWVTRYIKMIRRAGLPLTSGLRNCLHRSWDVVTLSENDHLVFNRDTYLLSSFCFLNTLFCFKHLIFSIIKYNIIF